MDENPIRGSRPPLSKRQRTVTALYETGKTSRARKLLLGSRELYPERPAMVALWIAEVHARYHNDLDAALAELARAVHEGGVWYAEPLLRAQRFLTPAHGRPEFERLVAVCEWRCAQAQARAAAVEPTVHKPPGTARGLLVVLHGRTGRMPYSARPWERAIEAGFVVLAPQSSRLSSSDGTYDWPDAGLALEEVSRHYEETATAHELKGRPLVFGGISRGARLALGWGLAGELGASGIVSVCPVMRDRAELDPLIPGAVRRETRGLVVVGEWDWAAEETTRVCRELKDGGLGDRLEVETMSAVDHGYPDDFESRLVEELERFAAGS